MDLRGRSEQEESLVVADGNFTRYQGSAYGCARNERAFNVNLGGIAGVISCPFSRGRSFFILCVSLQPLIKLF